MARAAMCMFLLYNVYCTEALRVLRHFLIVYSSYLISSIICRWIALIADVYCCKPTLNKVLFYSILFFKDELGLPVATPSVGIISLYILKIPNSSFYEKIAAVDYFIRTSNLWFVSSSSWITEFARFFPGYMTVYLETVTTYGGVTSPPV